MFRYMLIFIISLLIFEPVFAGIFPPASLVEKVQGCFHAGTLETKGTRYVINYCGIYQNQEVKCLYDICRVSVYRCDIDPKTGAESWVKVLKKGESVKLPSGLGVPLQYTYMVENYVCHPEKVPKNCGDKFHGMIWVECDGDQKISYQCSDGEKLEVASDVCEFGCVNGKCNPSIFNLKGCENWCSRDKDYCWEFDEFCGKCDFCADVKPPKYGCEYNGVKYSEGSMIGKDCSGGEWYECRNGIIKTYSKQFDKSKFSGLCGDVVAEGDKCDILHRCSEGNRCVNGICQPIDSFCIAEGGICDRSDDRCCSTLTCQKQKIIDVPFMKSMTWSTCQKKKTFSDYLGAVFEKFSFTALLISGLAGWFTYIRMKNIIPAILAGLLVFWILTFYSFWVFIIFIVAAAVILFTPIGRSILGMVI